jgi:phosphoglycolate phosphatase-like HAD superfamily hydrolase
MYGDIARKCGIELTQDDMDYCKEHSMNDNIIHIFKQDVWNIIKDLPYIDYFRKAKPMPNIITTLVMLKRYNIPVSICSNRISGIPIILDWWGMTHLFDNVVTSKEYPSKPDPKGLLSLIDGESCYIGDSDTDRQTSHNAGIPFIAYNNTRLRADYHIKNHSEILYLTPIINYGIKIAGGLNGNS